MIASPSTQSDQIFSKVLLNKWKSKFSLKWCTKPIPTFQPHFFSCNLVIASEYKNNDLITGLLIPSLSALSTTAQLLPFQPWKP